MSGFYCEECEGRSSEFCSGQCEDCGEERHCNKESLCRDCQDNRDEAAWEAYCERQQGGGGKTIQERQAEARRLK